MTDDFDVSLRRRLEALASAAPVAPPGEVTGVVRQPIRARSTRGLAMTGLLPVLAAVVIGAVLASVMNVGQAPGDSSAGASNAANGPIEATTRSGDFELTIRSAKARYEVGEPIDIKASLAYLGSGSVQIAHGQGAGGTAVGFGIEEPVLGDLRLAPTYAESCERSTLEGGTPLEIPFAKGGGWSGDDPRADEYRAWFQDPALRLPVGVWHVYSVAGFSIDTCSPDPIQMRVDLTIEVRDADTRMPSPSASMATPRPTGSTAIDLRTQPEPAKGCRLQYNEGTLGRYEGTGLGILTGPTPATGLVPATGVVWPFGYTAREQNGAAVLFDPDGRIVAREGNRVGFSGPGPAADGFIYACNDIRVVETGPTDDPGFMGVHAVDDDGTFRLELRSSKSVYAAGEPLDIEATLAYIGSGGPADFDGGILFKGTEVDGSHSFSPGPMVAICVPRPIRDLPDERQLADWRKVRSLPAGTWRISAWFSGSAPACTQGGSSLVASIDVMVVAAEPARTIPLLTAGHVDEISSDRFCRLDTPHGSVGELALDPTSGLGLASDSGEIQPIRWPPGFTAELLPDGAILYGEGGQIVGREREAIGFPAGTADDGVLTVCGQFLFP